MSVVPVAADQTTLPSAQPTRILSRVVTRFLSRSHSTSAALDAAERIKYVATQHGLEQDDLMAVLPESLHAAVQFVYDTSRPAAKRRTMRELVAKVEDILDLEDPIEAKLRSPAVATVSMTRAVFAGVVFVCSVWIVVGAMITGHNELANAISVPLTMAVLAVSLIGLALLEAAHIGAVALSGADVSMLGATHPRVVRLHRYIDTKEKLEAYLAARQLCVVLIVFVIAEVTRVIDLQTFPGTTIPVPAALDIILRIGAPGALVVLIVAQVAPQVIAARRPAALMNLAPMAAAFHFTRLIGHLGLAKPGAWLVGWAKGTERIATAPRGRYRATTIDAEGIGTVAICRHVEVGHDMSTSTTRTTTAFYDDTRNTLLDETASCPRTPRRLTVRGSLLREDERYAIVVDSLDNSPIRGTDGVRVRSSVSPRLGAFQPNDLVESVTRAAFEGSLTEDFVSIEQPTKLVVLRVTMAHPAAPLPPATLTLTRVGSDDKPFDRVAVEPVVLNDGITVEFVASVLYPETGTKIHLSWGGQK